MGGVAAVAAIPVVGPQLAFVLAGGMAKGEGGALMVGALGMGLDALGASPPTGAGAPNRIYSARALIRQAQEPGPFHNFPESVTQDVFAQGTRTVTPNFYRVPKPGLSNDSVMYQLGGTVNGVQGTFELGVRPSVSGKTEVIIHTFFRPDP